VKAATVGESVLVIVDVQGKLAALMTERDRLYRKLAIVIQAARILHIPILWCEQVPTALGPTVPEIACHLEGLTPLAKSTFSCWHDRAFRSGLLALDRRQVLLCGIEAHICVYQTARDLLHHGFDVHVLADAISSRTVEDRDFALQRIDREGGALCCVEMILFDLLKDAKHPNFKELSRLIK
jgi:nicotinamidase-related amidase